MLEYWAQNLDLVISLDAPDDELVRRVQRRSKHHVIKQKTPQQALDFVNDFRTRFRGILSFLQNEASPIVLHFDTSFVSVEDVVERVVSEYDQLGKLKRFSRKAA